MLEYVATIIQLGVIQIIGPVTKQLLTITPTGSWIPEEDADELIGKLYKVPCRLGGFTEKVGIYKTVPSN